MSESNKNKPESNKPKSLISKDVYQILVKNTSALFLYNDTISLIKQDETFQRVICDYLDAIYTYEDEIKNKDEQLDNLLVAYKTITGKPYDPSILSKNQIDDLDDKMSFLEIYLRNTLKIELSDIIEKFNKDNKKIDPDTLVNIAAVVGGGSVFNEQTTNANNDNVNSNSNNKNAGEENNQFNAEDFLKNNNVNFNEMADAAIAGYSRNLLYNRVLKNEFFVFDSKPSFFVWIKWVYLFGMIFAFLAFLATFIINTLPMEYIFVFGNVPANLNPRESLTWFLNNSNLVYSRFWNTNYFILILSILFLLMMSSNAISNCFKEIKYRNNDNYRFSCSFSPIFLLIMGLLFIYLLPLINNIGVHPLTWMDKVFANPDFSGTFIVGPERDPSPNADVTLIVNNSRVYANMLAMSILPICLFSFTGLAILCSIGIKLIAPKKNYDLIQTTLLQIANDIKNNKISILDIQKRTTSIQMKVMNDIRRFL